MGSLVKTIDSVTLVSLFSQAPDDQEFTPVEFNIPIQTQSVEEMESEPEPQETVEEYINPQGIKMKRIIRRTVVIRIVNINGKPERVEEPHEEVYEEPVSELDQPEGDTVDERIGVMRVQKRVELPDWEPFEISHRPRQYEPEELDEPVEEKPAKPVSGLAPFKPLSEELIKPSTLDRSYTLPDFDEEMPDEKPPKADVRPKVNELSEPFKLGGPKQSTVSVRMPDKENPLKFKITTVKKSQVGPRKSNELVNLDEPNKVGFDLMVFLCLYARRLLFEMDFLFLSSNFVMLQTDHYVDKDGRPVRQITTKKITTRTVINGNIGEPNETTVVPDDHLEFQLSPEVQGAPVDVKNIKDDEGQKVTKITRKTLVTKHVTKDGVDTSVCKPIEEEKTIPVFVPREPVSKVRIVLN